MPGLTESARRAAEHLGAVLRLQRELARAELKRKGGTAGAGAGLAIGAGVLSLFAIGFGLAAAAAGLATAVDWWLALLIVFAVLLLLVAVLLLVARYLFKASAPLKPEQAIAEAKLTKQVLRGRRAG
jgi:hypothetical protein